MAKLPGGGYRNLRWRIASRLLLNNNLWSMSRNPAWTDDELILALDLYFRLNPARTSDSNPASTYLQPVSYACRANLRARPAEEHLCPWFNAGQLPKSFVHNPRADSTADLARRSSHGFKMSKNASLICLRPFSDNIINIENPCGYKIVRAELSLRPWPRSGLTSGETRTSGWPLRIRDRASMGPRTYIRGNYYFASKAMRSVTNSHSEQLERVITNANL